MDVHHCKLVLSTVASVRLPVVSLAVTVSVVTSALSPSTTGPVPVVVVSTTTSAHCGLKN